MYTKNAFKNLRNRYKAVLKKCTLLNTFGSLALASAFLMSGVCISTIVPVMGSHSAYASIVKETSNYIIEEYVSGKEYYKTFTMQEADATDTFIPTTYGVLLQSNDDSFSSMESFLIKSITAQLPTLGLASSAYTTIAQVSSASNDIGAFSISYFDENTDEQTLYFVAQKNGASLQASGTRVNTDMSGSDINSNFVGLAESSSTEDAYGGAIYNAVTVTSGSTNENITIGNITGDFISNYVYSADSDAYGGAIYNTAVVNYGSTINNVTVTATIGNITGDFIANYANSANASAYGGAISNYSLTGIYSTDVHTKSIIGNITGNFIGNYVYTANNDAYGGAIYNYAYINNHSSSPTTDSSATVIIGDITGDFIGNYAYSTFSVSAYGGAIYNSAYLPSAVITSSATATIGSITGNFIGNYVSANYSVYGGAIFNLAAFANNSTATIGNITGSFISNYAYSIGSFAFGGAIYNYANGRSDATATATASIGDIIGDFIANYTQATNGTAQGGAIYNSAQTTGVSTTTATIGNITGDFIGNYVKTTSGTAQGGAIYNYASNTSGAEPDLTATIGNISGSFIGNYAQATSGTAQSGAIYTNSDVTFVANNTTNIFSDNYTSTDTEKDYNAIYAEGGTLQFTMTGLGNFVMNDSILGNNEYSVNITGDSTANIFYLNDVVESFTDFSVKNATLQLGSYDHGDATTVASFLGAADSTMSFTNAHLNIDTTAFDGITTGTAVIDGNNATRLTVDTDSTLTLTSALANNTYSIAENFVSGTTLWNTENIIVTNALLEATDVSGDAINSAYTVTIGTNPESSIYKTPTAELLLALANSELYVANSTNAGIRLVYDIMEDATINDTQKIQIVEGAVQMGAVAGVQNQFATTITSANSVLDTRMLNANSINPSSTAMRVVDENGRVFVYDNITTVASNGNSNGMIASHQNYTEIWLMPMYAHEKISGVSSGNFSNTGYQSDMYGVALGIDRTYQDKYRIGLAFDMGSGNSESNGDYASTENDYDFFGFTAYGSVRFDNLSILGSIGYTNNDSEVAQNLSAYGYNNLYSDIKSDVWNFTLKAEYNYAFCQGYNLTPYVGVQYMSMSTDDYKVKDSNSIGSGTYGETVFNVNADRQDVFSFPLGVAFSKEIHTENGWGFSPKMNAGVIFATGDLYATSVSSIPEIDASSSMSLKVIDSTTLDLGLGVSASKDNFTMMLDYDFQYSEHRTAHGVMAKVLFTF